jgi:hypothetical protein
MMWDFYKFFEPVGFEYSTSVMLNVKDSSGAPFLGVLAKRKENE